ncbi:MAG: DUF2220 family protein [Desulfobulbus sp.]|nr:DUF2220 family protein [Desulfobulbus sp.]
MDWKNPEYRAALLRLWRQGLLKQTKTIKPLAQHLLASGWVTQSPRRDELEINDFGRASIPGLLESVWPSWQETLHCLDDAGLEASAEGLRQLTRQSRPTPLLPLRLHRKTYCAIACAHSKSRGANATPPPNLTLTMDGVLRLRTNQGLLLCRGAHSLPSDDWMAAAGEIILPERALLDGVQPGGVLPRAIMTVENLGTFVDMPKPEELLLIHQPGWNTPLSCQFMRLFAPTSRRFHFGDLDPEGLDIYLHLLHRHDTTIRLFVPTFWREYEPTYAHALPADGRQWDHPDGDLALLPQDLVTSGKWLEQEPIVLDERFERELAGLLAQEKLNKREI